MQPRITPAPWQRSRKLPRTGSAEFTRTMTTLLASLALWTGSAFADALDDKLSALRNAMGTYRASEVSRMRGDMKESFALGSAAFRARRWSLAFDAFEHESKVAQVLGEERSFEGRVYRGLSIDWYTLSTPQAIVSLVQRLSKQEIRDETISGIAKTALSTDELENPHLVILGIMARNAVLLAEERRRLSPAVAGDIGALCGAAWDRFASMPRRGAYRTLSAADFADARSRFCGT